MAKKISGGEIVARALHREGVDTVFGIIDGTYFGFYSSLRKYKIKLISPRHETSAVHMAAAYARLTGRLGVCMASNGPGVANALPGIAVENTEGNRVLFISSSRRHPIIYPDRGGSYQCFDQTGVIRPMAKWSETAMSFERIGELTRNAFRQCYTGRPGVVHLEIPENLMNSAAPDTGEWPAGTYGFRDRIYPSPETVERAGELLMQAKRPLIHAGSGVFHSGALEELRETAERLHAPVTTSWGGRGCLDERHELAVPMLYVKLNNEARNQADLVLTLGSRMGETDWWGKAPYWAPPKKQKMIQVDLDSRIIGAHKPCELPVQADIKAFLSELNIYLADRHSGPPSSRKRFVSSLNQKQQKMRAKLDEKLEHKKAPMLSGHVARICNSIFADDAILVIDGGNTAIWANFFHEIRVPNTVLGTPKMGMLGAGVAQATGAAAAFPDRQVYCILGDGAMGFHPQEVETAIRNNLKVIYIVLCDKQWGMVKMNQQFALKPLKTFIKKSLGPHETINADLGEIEFDVLARSMGAHGERVNNPADFEEAVRRSLAAGKCAVIHVDVDPVKHMWAPSLIDFKNMHQEPKGK